MPEIPWSYLASGWVSKRNSLKIDVKVLLHAYTTMPMKF